MFHFTEELMTDNDPFLSFAKRSRIVQRRCEMEEASFLRPFPQPWSSQQATFDFWDSERYEVATTPYKFPWAENHIAALAEPEGSTMEQALFRGWLGKPGPGLGRLPTPAELMGRRKKRGGQGNTGSQIQDSVQDKGTVVLHHIRDLKKKQGVIDQLKKEKWWSSAPDCKSNTMEQLAMMEVGELSHLETPDDPSDCIELRNDASTGVLVSPVLHKQEVTFGGYEKELSRFPGGNPMLSFVLATAERQVCDGHYTPFCSQKEFCVIK